MNETQEAPAHTEGGKGRRWKQVFAIIDGPGDRKFWPRVGTAFENRDNSWNLKLDVLPLNGVLHIRDPEPVEATDDQGARGEQVGRGERRVSPRRESSRESKYASQGVL